MACGLTDPCANGIPACGLIDPSALGADGIPACGLTETRLVVGDSADGAVVNSGLNEIDGNRTEGEETCGPADPWALGADGEAVNCGSSDKLDGDNAEGVTACGLPDPWAFGADGISACGLTEP